MNLRSPLTGELMPSKPPKKKKGYDSYLYTPNSERRVM